MSPRKSIARDLSQRKVQQRFQCLIEIYPLLASALRSLSPSLSSNQYCFYHQWESRELNKQLAWPNQTVFYLDGCSTVAPFHRLDALCSCDIKALVWYDWIYGRIWVHTAAYYARLLSTRVSVRTMARPNSPGIIPPKCIKWERKVKIFQKLSGYFSLQTQITHFSVFLLIFCKTLSARVNKVVQCHLEQYIRFVSVN